MQISVSTTRPEMARAAAECAAGLLRQAIARQGQATFIAATGASQFDFLAQLTSLPGIAWERTTMFHLDEYVGLPVTHPASFRGYLRQRLVERVHPACVNYIEGDAPDVQAEIRRLNALLANRTVDVAFVGIGENGHLAFNDPPADFEIDDPYLVVNLDTACRRQQMGEGWFATLEDVPKQAISMSIRQIMRARAVVCTVPDQRKAQAVQDCLTGPVSNLHPASILRDHPATSLFLDAPAASLLKQ